MREFFLPTIKITFIPNRKVNFSINFEKIFDLGLYDSTFLISFQDKNLEISGGAILDRLIFNQLLEKNLIEDFQPVFISVTTKVNERLLDNFFKLKSKYDINYEEFENKFNEIKSNYENYGFILEFESTSLVPFYLFLLDELLNVFVVEEVQ
ncbi:hypothetical protein PGDDIFCJ_00054 [Thermus phage YS40_Isch]|nr:hypothetical protein PGDDIFCJ_00054 [Thermus phage YS40_Isch]